jgi:hypothetical protein
MPANNIIDLRQDFRIPPQPILAIVHPRLLKQWGGAPMDGTPGSSTRIGDSRKHAHAP